MDLPGLFLAGNKDQTEEDAGTVEALVLSYMKKPRTIILAVVSAKSDFALQQVTRHARARDPKGLRTLGLITKPDTLDKVSDCERFYVELAQNKDVQFRLGWHVLRNRSFAERDSLTAARDAAETEFFSGGIWTSLRPLQLGVAALRVRLSNVLRDQILRQLPSVLDDVRTGTAECKGILARLGEARATATEQRRYLLVVSAKVLGPGYGGCRRSVHRCLLQGFGFVHQTTSSRRSEHLEGIRPPDALKGSRQRNYRRQHPPQPPQQRQGGKERRRRP